MTDSKPLSDDADLTLPELSALIRRVFEPGDSDSKLALLVDLPDAVVADQPRWRERRAIALKWLDQLTELESEIGLEPTLFFYRNAHRNNADLPHEAWRFAPALWPGDALPDHVDAFADQTGVKFKDIFEGYSTAIALTQFSATAPLKLASREHGFRAATMPGFGRSMLPALRLDFREIHRRVWIFKDLLDRADHAALQSSAAGRQFNLTLDLRFRSAHASSGLCTTPGTAGNLPSGETYIVPYEGERPGEISRSAGHLPVQFGSETVIYRIENNRAVGVESKGPESERERQLLHDEPAYSNLAELGLGVLADFGIEPIGEILLDEKLGLHIAFGRSDHFGGQVGAAQFSSPDAVVHIDRVYLPQTQPDVRVEKVDLHLSTGEIVPLIRDRHYIFPFDPDVTRENFKSCRGMNRRRRTFR